MSWSPDGQRLALTLRQGVSTTRLGIFDVSSGGVTLLGSDGDKDPSWSPDGTTLAFARPNGSTADIWRIEIDGTGAQRLVSGATGSPLDNPVWSHDGTRLAYRDGGIPRLLRLATGVSTTPFTVSPALDPVSWAPDDQAVVFSIATGGVSHLFIGSLAAGATPARVTSIDDAEGAPTWTGTASGGGGGGGGGTTDTDGDGLPNTSDNCPGIANADQADRDGDGIGDLCDITHGGGGSGTGTAGDNDGDGVPDSTDNCPGKANPGQADTDGDGTGDACDTTTTIITTTDHDHDGILDTGDNCPGASNPSQADKDNDGVGDACDDTDGSVGANGDNDGDGTKNGSDNCPGVANRDQIDSDHDGAGDACDDPNDNGDPGLPNDRDGDGIVDANDNCRYSPNANQQDSDKDGIGDVCDDTDGRPGAGGDNDGDGTTNGSDDCPGIRNPDQADSDGDGIGDACDDDSGGGATGDDDGDGATNGHDNCPGVRNPDQADTDGDGFGDACDDTMNLDGATGDDDGDGVDNGHDNCPGVPQPSQADTDHDGIGDACETGGGGGGGGTRHDNGAAASDGYAVQEGGTLSIVAPGVIANDSGSFRSGARLVSSDTPNGALTFRPDGSFTFRAPQVRRDTTYGFVYEGVAADGSRSSPVSVAIGVIDSNHPPVAKGDWYTMRFGEQFKVKAPGPLKNDSDPDGIRPASIVVTSAPAGVTAGFSDDGKWFLVSCSAAKPCSIGQTLTIKYQAVDLSGARSNVATINIGILKNTPGPRPDTYTVKAGATLDVPAPGPLANDTCRKGDCEGLQAFKTATSFPVKELPSFDADGSFSVTGTKAQAGKSKTITYRALDVNNIQSDQTTITVKVVADAAPVARNDAYSIYTGTSRCTFGYGILGNDTDPDGPTPTKAEIVQSSFGRDHFQGTWTGDGTFCYVAGQSPRTSWFTYRAIDREGTKSGIAKVTLNIVGDPVPRNDDPVAHDEIFYAPAMEGSTFDHFLANDSDPEGKPLRYSITSTDMPAGTWSLDDTAGTFHVSAPPLKWVHKTFTFHYAVIDDQGRRDFAVATVVIDPPPQTCERLDIEMHDVLVLSLKGSLKYCWDRTSATLDVSKPFKADLNDVAGFLLDAFTLGVELVPQVDEPTPVSEIPWRLVPAVGSWEISDQVDLCISAFGAVMNLFGPGLAEIKDAIRIARLAPFGSGRLVEYALKEGSAWVKRLITSAFEVKSVGEWGVKLLEDLLKFVTLDALESVIDGLQALLDAPNEHTRYCLLPEWKPDVTMLVDWNGNVVDEAAPTNSTQTYHLDDTFLSTKYLHPRP